MAEKRNFKWGINSLLEDYPYPVITDYYLYWLIFQLLKDRKTHGHEIDIRTKSLSPEMVRKRISDLTQGYLSLDSDFSRNFVAGNASFPRRVWKNPTKDKGTAAEVASVVDPFCYVSHLSAMQLYGLTNRNPKDLMLTVPGRKAWKELSPPLDKAATHNQEFVIPFLHISLPQKLRGQKLHVFTTEYAHPTAIPQQNNTSRVAPIGHCFIDMLSEPHLCGGINYVMEVFQEHAGVFLQDIIEAGDTDSRPIIKVRLGYILSEYLGYQDTRVEQWVQFAQRGSSRKLDAKKPFNGTKISEKWMLSLND